MEGDLPTEAEWEFAARSRGQDCRWAGKNQVANINMPKAHLSASQNAESPVPVAVKTYAGEDETEQKVFDMTGNVREWCLDVYRPYSAIISRHKKAGTANQPLVDPREGGEPDPNGQNMSYVVRGGSFLVSPDDARTFQRNAVTAESELNDLGFRVVIQCPPEIDDVAQ